MDTYALIRFESPNAASDDEKNRGTSFFFFFFNQSQQKGTIAKAGMSRAQRRGGGA